MAIKNKVRTQTKNADDVPFVSVVVLTYNRSEILRPVILSLINQDYPKDRYEIIVVDDGSSDDTYGVVLDLKKSDSRISYYFQEDRGFRAGQARNIGGEKARGSILIFLNDDIIALPNLIRNHVTAIKDSDCILGYAASYVNKEQYSLQEIRDIINSDISRLKNIRIINEWRDSFFINKGINNSKANKHVWKMFVASNFSIKREVFLKNKFNESFVGWGSEDHELGYRLLKSGHDIRMEKCCTGLHMTHKNEDANDLFPMKNLIPYIRNLLRFYKIHTVPEIEEHIIFYYNLLPDHIKSEKTDKLLSSGIEGIKKRNPKQPVSADIPCPKTKEHIRTFYNLLPDYIKSEKTDKLLSSGIEGIKKRNPKQPVSADIPLTFLCNNNCISCIIDSRIGTKKGHLPWSEIRQRIDRLPEPHGTIGITGGEPTISKSFFRTMSYLKDSRPESLIFLVSNGRMFSYPEFAKRFSGIGIRKLRVGIAIYSHDPEIHDSITMSRGSWEQTVRGIENLLKSGVSVELRIIINRLNFTAMEDTSRFIADKLAGIERVVFINMKYTGNAFRNREMVFVDYKQAVPHITRAVDILMKGGIETRLFHFPLCTIPQRYRDMAKGVTKQKGELSFVKQCEKCSSREECPMIWKSYLVLAGEDEFRPI